MKVDFNVSGWDKGQTYEKFDVVFFSGDPEVVFLPEMLSGHR